MNKQKILAIQMFDGLYKWGLHKWVYMGLHNPALYFMFNIVKRKLKNSSIFVINFENILKNILQELNKEI